MHSFTSMYNQVRQRLVSVLWESSPYHRLLFIIVPHASADGVGGLESSINRGQRHVS